MQIHWHEGLFLLPHHLQRLQRIGIDAIARQRRLARPYAYGTVEATLSREDLEAGRLRFTRLRAIMPGGLEVDFPASAELPTREIKEAMEKSGSTTVYLAVPLWFGARGNCVVPGSTTSPNAKILYQIAETEWADENTGSNTKVLLERRINARLLLDDEDRSDLEVIPLLRVVRSAGDNVGLPRQDPEFAGPCIVTEGSLILLELLRGLASQLHAARQELLLQVTRGGFSIENVRGIQFEQMMRLQILNRASARIDTLLAAPSVPPLDYYLMLRDLLGELSALHPDRDLFDCLPYNHDDPCPPFLELARKIRLFLRGAVNPNFIKVDFVESDGLLRAGFTSEHFTEPTDYFLGIRSREDPIALARFVENEDQFKLMPESLAERAVRGVLLKEERLPPLELPAQSGLYYFRVVRQKSEAAWKQIAAEKSAVVRWSGNDSADYTVSLYMTLPPKV